MKKLVAVGLGALVAASAFVPAAQAKRRVRPAAAMMMAPANPRVDQYGQFYATPVQPGDPTAVLLAPVLAPVGVAGAVVGGVTDPILGGAGGLPGLDVLAAPLR